MSEIRTTVAIAGPWVSESRIQDETEDRGLAVIAVLPELARDPGAPPTRGMVAWVHSGIGACETDAQAVATATLIAAAPDLLAAAIKALNECCDLIATDAGSALIAAIAKAHGKST